MKVYEYWLDGKWIKRCLPAPIEGIQGERFSTAKAIELMQKGHIVSSDVGQEDYYILVDGELYGYGIDMNLQKVSVEEMARMFTETWYYIK